LNKADLRLAESTKAQRREADAKRKMGLFRRREQTQKTGFCAGAGDLVNLSGSEMGLMVGLFLTAR